MISFILGFCIEIAIQTVFLTAALWIMIKLQKLEYNFAGLVGAAALTNILDRILDLVLGHFLGGYFSTYISTPIVVAVLLICITKITHADKVDVIFTVGISYALLFCMNLFLLGALMGDLRPDLRQSADDDQTASDHSFADSSTNSETQKAAANSPAAKPVEGVAKNFSVKGLIRNGSKSMLTLSDGTKIYTLYLGETTPVQTPKGTVFVQFDHLTSNSVVLLVDGTPVKLPAP